MKKWLAVMLAVLMTLMAFAGCDSGSEAPAADSGAEGVDILKVGLTAWPATLDPAVAMGKKTTRIIAQIYDTLLYSANDGTITSYICDSWEKIEPMTAEFKLKEGITFHNGDPLTSADVKFSFDRCIFDETGYTDPNVSAVVPTIESIEIVDDLTLRIHTKIDDPILFNRLASYCGVYIVPEKYLTEVGTDVFATKPMGTGPYKVDNITAEKLELSYYDGYYGEKPLADKVEYRYISEETALMTALITGEIHIAPDLTTTTAETLRGQSGVNVVTGNGLTAHLLRFNTKSGICADKKLRQALSLAIDRQLLVESLWGEYASLMNGYNFPAFDAYYLEDYPMYEYNPEKAKELLAESSYNGEVISYQLIPGYYPMGVEAAEAIVDMWKQIGVNAQVEFVEAIKTKTIVNLANWSNGLRYNDPLGGLWVLWGEGSGPQKDLWDAPERFNELGHLVETETDVEARREYYREMCEIWDDEIPGTILYNPTAIYAINERLQWNYVSGKAINFRAGYLTLN